MKKMILVATLAALIPMAAGQSVSLAASSAVRGGSVSQQAYKLPPKAPSWCKPCLYYSGDIDTTNPNADAFLDEYNASYGIDGQVFGVFKNTTKTVKVTGAAINSFGGSTTTDPTPYAINKGMGVGNGGKTVCSGNETTTVTATGRTNTNWGVPTEYSIVIKKLTKACTLKKGSYWLLIYPQSSNLWYESDEESDPSPINHVGWKNVLDKSLCGSAPSNYSYCNTQGSLGGDDFSFGLIGK